MAKKQFDLAAAISGIVSDLDTNAVDVRMIPLVDIIPNPQNFYKIDREALEPLMHSIAMDGLHHYPLVTKHPEQEGKWQLIDGERRYTACLELVKEGDTRFQSIPCTVRAYESSALAELQLILSNSTNRVLSSAEIAKQAEKTELLFYRLKEEGYEFPGRMRDLVAAACKVSASKLARLKVIREKLYCEFLCLFEQNKLPEQTAYALARLPVELQHRISTVMGTNIPRSDTIESLLKQYEQGWRWDAKDLQCPDGTSCPDGDRFLRHDLENRWSMCGGNRCCLTCGPAERNYAPCERMCSHAKAVQAAKKAEAEEHLQAERRERESLYRQKTQECAKRLLRAIDAVGLADEVKIPWERWNNCTVESIRRWAQGDFQKSGSWYKGRLTPETLECPAQVCALLHCSADYLLGLTDEIHGGVIPASKWRELEEVYDG